MGVRIWAQSIFGEDHRSYSREGYAVINEGIERLYAKVLASDTKVNVSFVERSTYLTSHAHLELFNNAEILKGIIRAEDEGYGVAFVRCGARSDPTGNHCFTTPFLHMTHHNYVTPELRKELLAPFGPDRLQLRRETPLMGSQPNS